MKLRSVLPMRVAKYGCILISLLFCYTGVRMTLHATPFGMEFYLFFGIAMMLFAVVKLIAYFSKDLFRLAFQYDLQLGILLELLGALTLIKRRSGVEFVCTTYAVSVIADCLFKIRTALNAKRFGIRQWWLTFALAIVAGTLGGVSVALAQTGKTEEQSKDDQNPETVQTLPNAKEQASKNETVYVLAGSDGAVQKISVSDWIENTAKSMEVTDYTELTNVENVKGDEGYAISGENMKVWDAQGNDLYY